MVDEGGADLPGRAGMPEQDHQAQDAEPTPQAYHNHGKGTAASAGVPMPPRPTPVEKLKGYQERAVDDRTARERP